MMEDSKESDFKVQLNSLLSYLLHFPFFSCKIVHCIIPHNLKHKIHSVLSEAELAPRKKELHIHFLNIFVHLHQTR